MRSEEQFAVNRRGLSLIREALAVIGVVVASSERSREPGEEGPDEEPGQAGQQGMWGER